MGSTSSHLWLAAVGLLLAATVSACGRSTSTDDDATPIKGSERLGWDQNADSIEQLQALTFRLYVDGTLSVLAGVRCVETSKPYACSGSLPTMTAGRHSLELTAVLANAESSRSLKLTVLLGSSSTSAETIPGAVSSLANRVAVTSTCEDSTRPGCYRTKIVATRPDAAAALGALPDGRLLFVDGRRTVSVIQDDVLEQRPALILDDSRSDLVGLAVDSQFEATHSVFIAWTEESPTGPRLNVTRYRELGNTLAEPATIINGLSFRRGAVAPMAVDANGLLFLAMPAAVESPRGSIDSGTILRFDRNGAVPRDDPRMSPIVARGYSRPRALVAAVGPRLWLAGQDETGMESISSVALNDRTEWPVAPETALTDRVLQANLLSARTDGFYMASHGRLRRIIPTPDGSPGAIADVVFDREALVTAATKAPDGSAYVVVSNPDRSASIVRIAPR